MRTLGDLDDALDQDLAWRRVEMQALLAAIRASSGPAREGMCRAGTALAYAHWEGYTKNALTNYWKYVARKRLPYKSLAPNFVALGLERELIRQQGLAPDMKNIMRVQRLLECNEDRALLVDREVDTKSNLDSNTLEGLFAKLGLDVSPLSTKSHFIDYNLLGARNAIAHGEFLDLDPKAYGELHHEVLGLLVLVRGLVANAATTGAFRR